MLARHLMAPLQHALFPPLTTTVITTVVFFLLTLGTHKWFFRLKERGHLFERDLDFAGRCYVTLLNHFFVDSRLRENFDQVAFILMVWRSLPPTEVKWWLSQQLFAHQVIRDNSPLKATTVEGLGEGHSGFGEVLGQRNGHAREKAFLEIIINGLITHIREILLFCRRLLGNSPQVIWHRILCRIRVTIVQWCLCHEAGSLAVGRLFFVLHLRW